MIKGIKILAFSLLLLLISTRSNAQTCGFGCLGLGGFYAGYTYQNFEAGALNQKMMDFNPSASEFRNAQGFRLGANLFRTKYKDFLFTFKGYYQFLNQENTLLLTPSDEPVKVTHSLDLNYWGVGFDGGLVLLKFMDWKIIDAQLTFHNTKMTTATTQNLETEEDVFRSRKTKIGVELGSGFIFHLAGDYISLETTAAYSIYSIGPIENEDGETFNYSQGGDAVPIDKLIEKGGLTLILQINVGIPLY